MPYENESMLAHNDVCNNAIPPHYHLFMANDIQINQCKNSFNEIYTILHGIHDKEEKIIYVCQRFPPRLLY